LAKIRRKDNRFACPAHHDPAKLRGSLALKGSRAYGWGK
jgi:hypothetical protein